MRELIVAFAILASSVPGSAQYQGMTAEQCRRISDSQQQLTCLGQIRPPAPRQLSFGPFSPIGLPAVIQPVVEPAEPASRTSSDHSVANDNIRQTHKAVAHGE
jgi:hypothetical protein